YVMQFGMTKTQIDLFTQRVLEEVDSGMYNPLTIHLCLKAMEELTKRIKEGIAEQVLLEAEKYGKSFEYMGSKVQLSERRSYDYSDDGTWSELEKAKKKREELLKYLSAPLADPETGLMIYPAQFKVTPVISITLPR
ncbi:MAG: hypothetical protein R6W71_02820, partial [Bacteroidales bacterium]